MSQPASRRVRLPDSAGRLRYSDEEQDVWATLYNRQMAYLPGRVVEAFRTGLAALEIGPRAVPQVGDISARLRRLTGAAVEGVPAIIPPRRFFEMLAARRFPVATFRRRRGQIDYVEEPDLFHEVFGHCPLLTQPDYVDFIEGFGRHALALGTENSWRLFRLFWFTVEFGMMRSPEGPRAFGAGIVSSPAEARNACGGSARILPFDPLTVLRTPYRIDILQPVLFEIESFAQLRAILGADLAGLIAEARRLGDLPAPCPAASKDRAKG